MTNGIYILTSRSGERFAASTVTWASQASFKPPLIMVAVRRGSNVLRCMEESRVAVFHIFDRSEQAIAQKFFAATTRTGQTLNGEPYVETKSATPILVNLPAYLECEIVKIDENCGDHAIVILKVADARIRRPVQPLRVDDSPWRYGG